MCNEYILPLCTGHLDAVQECLGMERDTVSSIMDGNWTNMVSTSEQEEKADNQWVLSRWRLIDGQSAWEKFIVFEWNVWDGGDSYKWEWNRMVLAGAEFGSNV